MVGSTQPAYGHRRIIAVVACVAWLLGVEVLPNVHLAFHDRAHTHEADGSIVHVEDHEHDADGGHHHPHHPEVSAASVALTLDGAALPEQAALDHVPATGHAAAGIAHHAIALHRPPPPLLEPLPISRMAWWLETTRDDQHTRTHEARPTARGPPATT